MRRSGAGSFTEKTGVIRTTTDLPPRVSSRSRVAGVPRKIKQPVASERLKALVGAAIPAEVARRRAQDHWICVKTPYDEVIGSIRADSNRDVRLVREEVHPAAS